VGVSYAVRWASGNSEVPLVLSVLEDGTTLDREIATFDRTLWSWLGGAALLLLLSQALLLRWGLAPLRRVTQEVQRIEEGEQQEVEQAYPSEIAALTNNLNTLIRQERVRQTRYKEALSYLAHSLKTPLAVLRSALAEPAQLADTVTQQVARMDDIVQHQLGRAAASGNARFVPYLSLAPVAQRIAGSLTKVYADKGLQLQIHCPADLQWRIDEGDAFELLGNVMDNAAKWSRQRVAVTITRSARQLQITVDDDGPGFQADTQAILQIHVRADEKVPGHGVGLAVVNELVTSHGGDLRLERSNWGGGRVTVQLRSS
jgi:two-component system sensor histidine kinase PhoQ